MILDENLNNETQNQNVVQPKLNRFAVTPAVLTTEEQSSATLPTPASQASANDYRVIINFFKF